jgi:hypothetical protein
VTADARPRLDLPAGEGQVLTNGLGYAGAIILVELLAKTANQAQAFDERLAELGRSLRPSPAANPVPATGGPSNLYSTLIAQGFGVEILNSDPSGNLVFYVTTPSDPKRRTSSSSEPRMARCSSGSTSRPTATTRPHMPVRTTANTSAATEPLIARLGRRR